MIQKYYYGYDVFKQDTQQLANQCRDYNPDVILGVARGGATLAHMLASAYDNRNLFSINSIHYNGNKKLDTFDIFNIPDISQYKTVLVVDDIVDSGETMKEILKLLRTKFPNTQFKLAVLFYKPTAVVQPDYFVKEATQWIEFFWEVDVV